MEQQKDYTDDTILTSGDYMFTSLRNVSPSYLLELHTTRKTKDKELLKYIDNNLEKIKARQEDRLTQGTDPGYRLMGGSVRLTCAATDKMIYLTEKDARLELKRIKEKLRKHKKKKPVRVYECTKCLGWHLTSLMLEEWEKIKAEEDWSSSKAARNMRAWYEKGVHELTHKIAALEDEVKKLKHENASLAQSARQLRENIKALRKNQK
jgi:hypothetical protein